MLCFQWSVLLRKHQNTRAAVVNIAGKVVVKDICHRINVSITIVITTHKRITAFAGYNFVTVTLSITESSTLSCSCFLHRMSGSWCIPVIASRRRIIRNIILRPQTIHDTQSIPNVDLMLVAQARASFRFIILCHLLPLDSGKSYAYSIAFSIINFPICNRWFQICNPVVIVDCFNC